MPNPIILQIKRGLFANLPASGATGELFWTTDTNEIFVGTGSALAKLAHAVQVFTVANPSDLSTLSPKKGDLAKVTSTATLYIFDQTSTWVPVAVTAFGSQPANEVLASPDGSAGTPSFRHLVQDDLPTTIDLGTF